MEFIIYDTEYTSWEGCIENGWTDWQKQEIVQIAALKVNKSSLEVVAEFDVFIKPIINPILSDYFINLTGITNEQIQEKGISFADAYAMFYDFAKGLECFSHGWYLPPLDIDNPTKNMIWCDGVTIHENLEYNNMKEEHPLNYQNIAFWLQRMYKKNNIPVENQCSGEVAKNLGIIDKIARQDLQLHNALYDVYSILEGVRYFKAEGLFE